MSSAAVEIAGGNDHAVRDTDLLSQPLTDSGNGERFVKLHGRDVRYCPEYKAWLIWDGKRWIRDKDGVVHRMAKETARRLYVAALAISDKDERARVEGFARRSEDAKEIRAILECARNEQGMATSAANSDPDSWLLNCKNGTLDLHTGELRTFRREDLITKMCSVRFDPKAACPSFLRFLDGIFNGNPALIAYVQKAFGYALTGTVTEKVIFCLHGDGNNGKTTLLEAFRYVLGDYAGQVMIESLLSSSEFHRSTALADLADIKGTRFVTTSEADQGMYFAEGQIKQLTGMGQVKACRKYENPITFSPSFKIFMDSNHKPIVRGTDAAIWNRLKLIPFNVTIPKSEIDKNLLEKLKREGPGILQWAVEGCLEWQRDGLNETSDVTASVQEWREESDPFAGFFLTVCRIAPDATCTWTELWEAARTHAEAAGVEIKQHPFTEQLKRLGCRPARTKISRFWRGIRLKDDTDDA